MVMFLFILPWRFQKLSHIATRNVNLIFVGWVSFLCIFDQGGWQPTQSQLIQIYSVDCTDVYDTHNIEHRTEPVSH